MKILRKGQPVTLGAILSEVLERSSAVQEAAEVALYVVCLQDSRGLDLAMAVHLAAPGGPDPMELRERSQALGAAEPLLAGAAAVETLARALESLGGTEPPNRHLLGWTVREIRRSGGVPVVLLTDGIVLVTTLDTLIEGGDDLDQRPAAGAAVDLTPWSWRRPVMGKA